MSEEYEVKQGDCISSIAYEYGFFWETLWKHANNADLKQRRKDPNVLLESDVVHIPDLTPKDEPGGTEQRHRFRLRGVPAKLKVQVLSDDKPRANEPYQLLVDGRWTRGPTDADGVVEQPLPPNARSGKLIVGEAEARQIYPLSFGAIDPLTEESGIRDRLINLGYDAENDLPGAIRAFQKKEGLSVTGEVDEATRNKLLNCYGL